MEYHFAFDAEKNARLKAERGIGFEEIIALIESGKLLALLDHPNRQNIRISSSMKWMSRDMYMPCHS
jgi:uncharacterized DUF497 family protein